MTTCPECQSPVTSGDRLVCLYCGFDPLLERDDDCDFDYDWDAVENNE